MSFLRCRCRRASLLRAAIDESDLIPPERERVRVLPVLSAVPPTEGLFCSSTHSPRSGRRMRLPKLCERCRDIMVGDCPIPPAAELADEGAIPPYRDSYLTNLLPTRG